MDGLEFLAELAPIYRVFPSLPFALPPTSPNTHVIAWRKKTQTQIDIAYALKPKINQKTCHRQTHTALTGTTLTHNIHTYKTKNTAISVQPFSCIFQPGVIQQDEKEAIETLRPVVMKKVGFNLTQWGFRQMRKLFIDCLGSCLPSVLTQEQQQAGKCSMAKNLRSGHVKAMARGEVSKNMKNVKI